MCNFANKERMEEKGWALILFMPLSFGVHAPRVGLDFFIRRTIKFSAFPQPNTLDRIQTYTKWNNKIDRAQ